MSNQRIILWVFVFCLASFLFTSCSPVAEQPMPTQSIPTDSPVPSSTALPTETRTPTDTPQSTETSEPTPTEVPPQATATEFVPKKPEENQLYGLMFMISYGSGAIEDPTPEILTVIGTDVEGSLRITPTDKEILDNATTLDGIRLPSDAYFYYESQNATVPFYVVYIKSVHTNVPNPGTQGGVLHIIEYEFQRGNGSYIAVGIINDVGPRSLGPFVNFDNGFDLAWLQHNTPSNPFNWKDLVGTYGYTSGYLSDLDYANLLKQHVGHQILMHYPGDPLNSPFIDALLSENPYLVDVDGSGPMFPLIWLP